MDDKEAKLKKMINIIEMKVNYSNEKTLNLNK